MADESDKQQGRPRSKSDIQRVKDLYKSVDQLYGGFRESDAPKFQDPVSAEEHPQISGDVPSEPPEPTVVDADHSWMVAVLADLAEYAQKENLYLVHECIDAARRRVSEVLNSEDLHEGSSGSGPRRDDEH